MGNIEKIYVYENWRNDLPTQINWRKLARQYGISRNEIESMSPAFNMTYKE